MIKHIIWDWNGTLVDDVDLCVDILNKTLDFHGINEISIEEYKDKFFFPVAKFYETLGLPSFGPKYKNLANNYINEYRYRFKECALHLGALRVVVKLGKLGISQSILSAGQQFDLEKFTSFYGISRFMSKIDGTYNVEASGKKDRALAHCEELKFKPNEILMVGDTLHDWEVAQFLGCNAILSEIGHNNKERLTKLPVSVIKNLDEVVSWVLD